MGILPVLKLENHSYTCIFLRESFLLAVCNIATVFAAFLPSRKSNGNCLWHNEPMWLDWLTQQSLLLLPSCAKTISTSTQPVTSWYFNLIWGLVTIFRAFCQNIFDIFLQKMSWRNIQSLSQKYPICFHFSALVLVFVIRLMAAFKVVPIWLNNALPLLFPLP